MDEYNSGMDPEVKAYFKKIMNSFSMGALWLLSTATLGLFLGLGLSKNGIHWYNILFYIFAVGTLVGVVFYFRRVWRNEKAGS